MKLNVHLERLESFAQTIERPILATQLEEARQDVLKGCVRAAFDKVLAALHDAMLDLEPKRSEV